jgi:hypothetical protein
VRAWRCYPNTDCHCDGDECAAYEHAGSNCNAHCNSCPHKHGNCYPDKRDAHSHSFSDCDRDERANIYLDADCDRNCDGDARHANLYLDPHPNGQPRSIADPDANPDGYGNACRELHGTDRERGIRDG